MPSWPIRERCASNQPRYTVACPLADRPTWDMSPANAGLWARSSRWSSAILDAHQLFLTCIKYCGDCLLIEVSFPSKVTHMAARKTWRPIIFSCPDTGDRVQGLLPDVPEPRADDLHTITCAACDGVHFIDPRTGAMIGAERS